MSPMRYEKFMVAGGRGWRWHLRADNGRIISMSRETYVTEHACDYSIALSKSSSGAPVSRL
ncbi:YegP family protein [Methylobacterium indicum]|uniref:YegP family protein n=2 Tax=Methylobacterium indicum TaxID=1775910 RepID=UPI000A4E7865